MRLILLIILFAFSINNAFGQIEITGKVKSTSTDNPVINVMIKNSENDSCSFSDKYGRFRIKVQKLPCKISFVKDCFLKESIMIVNKRRLKIKLTPDLRCDTARYLIK